MSFETADRRQLKPLLARLLGRGPRGRDGASPEQLSRLVGPSAQVVLEIGANDGQDSLRLLTAFPDATLHCFEPEPRALALWRGNVQSERARLHELAICASDGPVAFYQSSGAPPGQEADFPDGWHLSGSVRPPTGHLDEHPWCTFESTIEVVGRTLDGWAEDAGVDHVDLIWADVQGAEADLVLGGLRTLASTRFLYTEFSDRELYEGQVALDSLLRLLPGWEVEEVYKHDVLLRNTALSETAPRNPSA